MTTLDNINRIAGSIDKRIGQRVRARRLEIAMSQEKLADLLGVTFQQVQKYEKGVNRIAASRLLDIATALEIPVAAFYDGLASAAPSCSAAPSYDEALATPDGQRLMRAFTACSSERVRKRLVDLCEATAGAQ